VEQDTVYDESGHLRDLDLAGSEHPEKFPLPAWLEDS